MGNFRFYTDCVGVGHELPLLEEMMDQGKPISYNTFMKYADRESVEATFEGYNWTGRKSNGLRLKDDYHVHYYKSRWGNLPCVYVVHSAIEHVFIPRS